LNNITLITIVLFGFSYRNTKNDAINVILQQLSITI